MNSQLIYSTIGKTTKTNNNNSKMKTVKTLSTATPMTVLMVTGNAAVMPRALLGFLRPIRTMTATIAAEMGEAAHGSSHYHALFAIGLVLFVITFLINTVADVVVRRAGGVQT